MSTPPFEQWPIEKLPLSARAIRHLVHAKVFVVADLLGLSARRLAERVEGETVEEVIAMLQRHRVDLPE